MRLPPGGPVARPCDRARDTSYDWKKGGKSDRTYQFPAAKTSELRLNMRGANHSPFLEAAEDERRADACIGRAMADRAGKGREAGGHLGFYGEGEADGDGRKGQAEGRLLGVEAVVQPRL